MDLVVNPSLTLFGQAVNPIALVRRMIVLSALALSVALLVASQAAAQDDVGLPMHPKTILSTIVRQSGEGRDAMDQGSLQDQRAVQARRQIL